MPSQGSQTPRRVTACVGFLRRRALRLSVALLVLALGARASGMRPPRYPWPFAPQDQPRPVENCYHTVLRPESPPTTPFGGPYLHGGIDIRMPAGTPILAVADGTLTIYREGSLDNVVLTESSGDLWEYRHVAPDSTPLAVRIAGAAGRPIRAGTVLGVVPAWGLDYDHLHLNRRSQAGEIRNPLDALHAPPRDQTPPEIRGIHLVRDGDDRPCTTRAGVIELSGDVDIVVDAIDRMEGARFGNPPLSFSWRVVPGGTWRDCAPFSARLPEDRGHPVPRYPRQGLAALYLLTGPLACVNPLPADGPQRFSLVITNVDRDGRPAAAGCWKTSELPNGEYTVEVVARDHAGNEAQAEVRVRIANPDTTGPK